MRLRLDYDGVFVDVVTRSKTINRRLAYGLSLSGFVVLFALFQNFTVATPIVTAAAPASGQRPDTYQAPFGCSIANQYTDCDREIRCPAGYYPEKMRAICNLESGSVDRTPLQILSYGEVRVVKTSTTLSDGLCSVDNVRLNIGNKSLPSPRDPVYGDFRIHCEEKDETSGSDCFVAGDMICKRYDGPMFMHKIELRDTRGPQGVARVGENFWLVTQDMDLEATKQIRFSLTSNMGKVLTDWTFGYDSHGQSLFVKSADAGAYDVYVENVADDGFLQFKLSATLDKLTFVREVKLKNPAGALTFKVFGTDAAQDSIVLFKKEGYVASDGTTKTRKSVVVLKLSSALNGVAEATSEFNVTGEYGALQGVALSGRSIFVLFGDAKLDSKKTILRLSQDGLSAKVTDVSVARELASNEGTKFEPEAVHVDSTYLYFAMVSSAWSRFYRIPISGL